MSEKNTYTWVESHNNICALLRQAHDALVLTSYPPRRKWQGLTDEELDKFDIDPVEAALLIAKLKEKNT